MYVILNALSKEICDNSGTGTGKVVAREMSCQINKEIQIPFYFVIT